MSFGESSSSTAVSFKKFVTEGEVEEQKLRRQAEWERVRKPEDPLEAPAEVHDDRSLFEKLQEQKDKAQGDYEDQFKLSNQVKGLDEEEADFLNLVSARQEAVLKQREAENEAVLEEYRVAMTNKVVDSTKSDDKKPAMRVAAPASSKKSQLSLLAGAIKRKSNTLPEDAKRRRSGENSSDSTNGLTASYMGEVAGETGVSKEIPGHTATSNNVEGQTSKVVGILPGIGDYGSDSDDGTSDSDVDTDLFPKQKVCVHSGSCGDSHAH